MAGNIAIIPARGGSKRLPGKNIRLLGGKPLIAHSIQAALDSGVFDGVFVSTDDPEIAEIAVEFGAEVPFMRDVSLADDYTPISAATLDAVRQLEVVGVRSNSVAQLMANCPLRDADDVRDSWASFQAGQYRAQLSVTSYGWLNPWWALVREADGSAKALFEREITQRSQDIPELYCPTGAIWWADVDALNREGTFHMQKRSLFELPWHKAVDIDDEADFEFAKFLFEFRTKFVNGASVPIHRMG